MKKRGYLFLIGFIALIMIVGLACSGGSTTPSDQPSQPQSQPQSAPPQSSNGNTNSSGNSSSLVTFTDQNKFYQIQVPGDWTHKSSTGTHYYIDQFKSPDGNALVENIAYNDGTVFSGSDNGKFALQILNQNYSSTGKEGDIHVSDDSIQKDGSERLTWSSSGGGYSGLSYFELRSNKMDFLMFTIEWSNNSKSTYLDTLNQVVASYQIP